MDQLERLTAALADRYRIERELGAGGMATVYLASDLKHDRKVALKVLKPELAAVIGAARFLAEIKTTANLQHPHILPLHDSGEVEGTVFYVMPFVEGESLRDRLNRERQLPIAEAVRIATEIASALDYAHRRGVIHRDIKPENILLHDGQALVADFGIALAASRTGDGTRITETGMSLGTPHYMSPEQAMGERSLDSRTDVYALGCVLYEMLAGEPPFTGPTAQAVVAKVLSSEPESLSTLRRTVPANVAQVAHHAIQKLPADRFESAKAFAEALANPTFTARTAMSTGAMATASSWNRGTVVMTGVAALLAILLGANVLTQQDDAVTERAVIRFALSDPALRVFSVTTRPFAVSPDGRTIVFAASTDTSSGQLWVRRLGDAEARPIPGTGGGINPAISPNGEWVAFVRANRELRKVRLNGGEVTTIATLDRVSAALSWASDDELFFEQIGPDAGIHRISANGGNAQLAVPLDSAAGEFRQRRPLVLRDARVVVYASSVRGVEEPSLVLYRWSDGKRERLVLPGIGALALIDDRLVYSRVDGSLMAVQLDAKQMRIHGSPMQLEQRVNPQRSGTAVGLSESGTLVYQIAGAAPTARLELVDTMGKSRLIPGEFPIAEPPRFSPDGRRILVTYGSGRAGLPGGVFRGDLWVVDATTGAPTRVTTNNEAASPSWIDNKRILYTKVLDGGRQFELWTIPVDGSAPASRFVELPMFPVKSSMAPDGKSVVVQSTQTPTSALLQAWLDGSHRIDTLIITRGENVRPINPRVSPDGKWVAYADRTTSEIWVRSLEGTTVLQVSLAATADEEVVWAPDSHHVYYKGAGGLNVVELQTTPTLGVVGRRVIGKFPRLGDYDIAPDGKTFVVVSPVRGAADILVAVDWATEARRQWHGSKQ